MAEVTTIQIRGQDKTAAAFSSVNRSLKKFDKNAKTAGSSAGILSGGLGKIGGMLGPLVGVAGITMLTKKLFDFGDRLDKVSKQIGISVEDLQIFQFAASQSGVGTDLMNKALQKFNISIGEANEGLGPGAEGFEKLGISITDKQGKIRKSKDLFGEVAKKVALIKDPAEKAAAAVDLFGAKAGVELLPLLNAGEGGIRGFERTITEAGGIIGGDTVDEVTKFNDSMDLVSRVAFANFASAVTPLIPVLTFLATHFQDIAKFVGIAGVAFLTAKIPAAIAGITLAVKTLTLAMASNPIGLLAIGVAAAGTAAYTYSDEISDFFGFADDKTVKDLEATNKELGDLAKNTNDASLNMMMATTDSSSLADQTKRLGENAEFAKVEVGEAAKSAEELAKQRAINVTIVEDTFQKIDKDLNPSFEDLNKTLKKSDKAIGNMDDAMEDLASMFNTMFLNMGLTSDHWTEYLTRRLKTFLNDTWGGEFLQGMENQMFFKGNEITGHWEYLLFNMNETILTNTDKMAVDFQDMMRAMATEIHMSANPNFPGVMNDWILMLEDMRSNVKNLQVKLQDLSIVVPASAFDFFTTEVEVPGYIFNFDAVRNAASRLDSLVAQINGYSVSSRSTNRMAVASRQGNTHVYRPFWSNEVPESGSWKTSGYNELSYEVPSISGGGSGRTGGRSGGNGGTSPASAAADGGGGSTVVVNIFDGTGQEISAFDSAIRVEIEERADRYDEFSALTAK